MKCGKMYRYGVRTIGSRSACGSDGIGAADGGEGSGAEAMGRNRIARNGRDGQSFHRP